MLKRILWAMLIACCTLPVWAGELPAQKVGDIPPQILGKKHGGDEINLEQYRGKVVIVTFWAS
ncbi:MAG TPA: hypothetical protein VIT22_09625 [Pseudoxanthomonas sp.]